MTEDKVTPQRSRFLEGEEQETSISRFNLFRHAIAVLLACCLLLGLIGSNVNQFIQIHKLNLISSMTPIYIILFIFLCLMTIWAVLSVKRVKVSPSGIDISNLFWREKINWSDFPGLNSVKNLDFALLKGKKSLYLLVKSELENYQQLESLIEHYSALQG